MDIIKMDMELHGLGSTITSSIQGHSIGDIIDRAIRKHAIEPGIVHGIKVEIDGVIIRLWKSDRDPGGET